MENYSLSSYPDSGNSSPRSRETDCENASWDEPLSSSASNKVKFLCSYGGKILPRPHDNRLAYVGGHTKFLSVDRHVRFAAFMAKLSNLCDSEVCFRYQLPGEDLDALISATNDEDLEHLMEEYDRLHRASAKPARLRLFLFPVNPPASGYEAGETKLEREWFVDALNSVGIQTSSPSDAAVSLGNTDFMFGLDKGRAPQPATVLDVFPKEIRAGSDCGSEDRHVIGEPVVSPAEIQRQIQEFQRFQITGNEQVMYYRNSDEASPRACSGDYYIHNKQEKLPPPQPAVPVTIPASYWHGRSFPAAIGHEPPVYLIQTPSVVYQALAPRPVTGQFPGPAYYGYHRVGQSEICRERPVYNTVPMSSNQHLKVGVYMDTVRMLRPPASAAAAGLAEPGYAPVAYDVAGRLVYNTAPGGVMPPYQAVTAAVDVRQEGGGVWNPERGQVVGKTSEAYSV